MIYVNMKAFSFPGPSQEIEMNILYGINAIKNVQLSCAVSNRAHPPWYFPPLRSVGFV